MSEQVDEYGVPLDPEQRRFYRLIEDREMNSDGTEEILLACGHQSTHVAALPEWQLYGYCAQCGDAWLAAQRKKAGQA